MRCQDGELVIVYIPRLCFPAITDCPSCDSCATRTIDEAYSIRAIVVGGRLVRTGPVCRLHERDVGRGIALRHGHLHAPLSRPEKYPSANVETRDDLFQLHPICDSLRRQPRTAPSIQWRRCLYQTNLATGRTSQCTLQPSPLRW